MASLANDWRWGLRVTPMLNLVAVVLLLAFLLDPPRGQEEAAKSDSKRTIAQEIKAQCLKITQTVTHFTIFTIFTAFTTKLKYPYLRYGTNFRMRF